MLYYSHWGGKVYIVSFEPIRVDFPRAQLYHLALLFMCIFARKSQRKEDPPMLLRED